MPDQPLKNNNTINNLERSFFFALLTHAVGLVSMAILVMPGMPGGLIADNQRIQYIAEHPWLWRLGWLPWQLSALSDLFVALAMWRLPAVSLPTRILVIVSTVAALIPDQGGQALWISTGQALALESHQSGKPELYLRFEEPVYMMVCGWAALFYTVLAVFWTIALKQAGLCGNLLGRFSYFLWFLSGLCSLLFLSSQSIKVPFLVLAIANAIFFPGLVLWFCFVLENIIASTRPLEIWGRYAPWKLPGDSYLQKFVQVIGASIFLRRCFEFIPPVSLASEIDGVVYVNYLLEAEKLEAMVPEHLKLQRLGPKEEYALFSILTFRHRHFGPQFFGPLRKFMLTGIVSNWRIHVSDPVSGLPGIYFLTNATDNVLLSLGARLLSEGMPMHLCKAADFKISEGRYLIRLDPGDGSAPDLSCQLTRTEELDFSGPWQECFGTYAEFLKYCVPQERAISSQSFLSRVCFQEIRLGIPLSECAPLHGSVSSRYAETIVGSARSLCFAAPSLKFRFDKEHHRRS